jgi:Mycothiol maleylpyruvate isomerase N-terminal domain
VAFLRADTRPLFPRLRAELISLLAGPPGGDWERATACPGWSVHAVTAHLLAVEIGNVSVRRDRWALGPAEGEDLDSWLNAFNQQWVDAGQRSAMVGDIGVARTAGGPGSISASTRAVSSVGERFPDTEEVTGSNPVRPTRSQRFGPETPGSRPYGR